MEKEVKNRGTGARPATLANYDFDYQFHIMTRSSPSQAGASSAAAKGSSRAVGDASKAARAAFEARSTYRAADHLLGNASCMGGGAMGPTVTRSTRDGIRRRSVRGASTARWLFALLATAALPGWAAAQPYPTANNATINTVLDFQQGLLDTALNGMPAPESITVNGITVNFYYNPADRKIDVRKRAVIEAINNLVRNNYQLPYSLNFILTPTVPGSDEATAEAFIGYSQGIALSEGCDILKWPPDMPAATSGESIAAGHYGVVFDQNRTPGLSRKCDTAARRKAREGKCMAVATHEICHLLHYGQNPRAAAWNGASRDNNRYDQGGWEAAAAEVSSYAEDNRSEFLAEVCSAVALGYDVPDVVMNAYRALGGPEANVPFTPLPGRPLP